MESSSGCHESSFIVFRADPTCVECVQTWQLMQSPYVTAVSEDQVSGSTSLCCDYYCKACTCVGARKNCSVHGETGASYHFLENDCEIEYDSD
jgi:hypothetical protein